jgi:protein phosphatase 1 regulatory subunit 21
LTKQLNQSSATNKSYLHELESARESIHQLQDQMMTLSSGYESQLSAMSDHLCEVQDKLTRNEEELDVFKKTKKKSGRIKS